MLRFPQTVPVLKATIYLKLVSWMSWNCLQVFMLLPWHLKIEAVLTIKKIAHKFIIQLSGDILIGW